MTKWEIKQKYGGVILGFWKYLFRRLIFLVLLIFGVATMVFIISHMVPSDPIVANLSQRNMNNPKLVEAFKQKWGFDQPLYIQYFKYIKALCKGDMGISIRTGNSVLSDLKMNLPATLELSFISIIFATLFGILFGIISATKRNRIADQILRGVSIMGVSIPIFWFSLIVLYLLYFKLGWAPGPGRLSPFMEPPAHITGMYLIDSIITGNWETAADSFKHLILPSIVLGSFTMGLIARTTRSSLLEVLSSDYIRTAKAKGVGRRLLLMRHALGNSMIPVLTVIGLGLANLLGGMVLVETIFAWPGIGQYAYQSVRALDFTSIIGVALLIALNYVLINLVVDLLYGLIDPRVRLK